MSGVEFRNLLSNIKNTSVYSDSDKLEKLFDLLDAYSQSMDKEIEILKNRTKH